MCQIKKPDYGDNVVRFFGKGCSFKDYARFSATESALETMHYKAEARFDQSLNAHKSSNEDNRIAYSKTGNNTLNVICVVEEET